MGLKVCEWQKTDQVAIRIYVNEKRDVPPEERIPSNIQGVVTDGIEHKIVLHPLSIPESNISTQADTGRYDPLKGGISIGPYRAIGGSVFSGTLGAIAAKNRTADCMTHEWLGQQRWLFVRQRWMQVLRYEHQQWCLVVECGRQ